MPRLVLVPAALFLIELVDDEKRYSLFAYRYSPWWFSRISLRLPPLPVPAETGAPATSRILPSHIAGIAGVVPI